MALASAFLEWLLIFMLFINAMFSYLVTKFARYSKLEVPCLLCSRLDHVLGNEKLGFYWDLICGNHKLEISSLVLCHMHNKLVDVHGTCESCLFSFATINRSNSETNRLMVGKLGADAHLGLDQDPLLEEHKLGSLSTRNCSCCSEPLVLRNHAKILLQTKPIRSDVAELDLPLTVAPEHNWDGLEKSREELSGSFRAYPMGTNSFGPLSHVEYTEVKVTSDSDTESEVPHSDDDGGSALICETADLRGLTIQSAEMEPHIVTLANNFNSEKLMHQDSAPDVSLVDSKVQHDLLVSHGNIIVASAPASRHGLEELDGSQVEQKVDASAATKFASVDEVPQSSNVMDNSVEGSTPSLIAPRTDEVKQKCVTESGQVFEEGKKSDARSETNPEINSIISNNHMPNNLDLGDAYKLAVGNKGRQLSGKLLEQRSVKDSARISEDLKLLLSQISAARGIELSMNDVSPRVSGNFDELKTDSSSSIGLEILQRRISLERNESNLSLDGSVVSEIEGENEVDRLKRQVEHDKKLMGALYKELEEERNASAVAANQAMAMITRLQEEKAALNMEALQCMRMMEEQAEYDAEALQKANDFLTEKEKEIQDLEAELEFHKNRSGDKSILENELGPTYKLRQVSGEHLGSSCFKSPAYLPGSSIAGTPLICRKQINDTVGLSADKNANSAKNSVLEFEEDRLHALQCLKTLEKRILQYSNIGVYWDKAASEHAGVTADRVSDFKLFNCKEGTEENIRKEEHDSALQNLSSVSAIEDGPFAQVGCYPSIENPELVAAVGNEFDCSGLYHLESCRPTDFVALGDAVSSLIGKLEAIKADHDFPEHCSQSPRRNGEFNVRSRGILSPASTMKDCE